MSNCWRFAAVAGLIYAQAAIKDVAARMLMSVRRLFMLFVSEMVVGVPGAVLRRC